MALFLLVVLLNISAYATDVCIVNSYHILPAEKLELKLKKLLKEHGNNIVSLDCSVKILIGTPAVAEDLKNDDKSKKYVYTFVLFPEELGLQYRKSYYGVRIFPLPDRTYKRFLKELSLKKRKVAVPVSEGMLPIARIYLNKRHFTIIPFKNSSVETFRKLLKYKYVYVFPDPKLLKIVNLVTLVDFCRDNRLLIFSGLSDLSKFNLDYVDKIDFDKLAKEIVFLVENSPREKILPCPCKEK